MIEFEKQTALVVDDSPSISQIVRDVLYKDLRFGNVLGSANGRHALNLIQTQKIDWVFCDIEMPEMDGLELLKNVRGSKKGENVPFFIMTSRVDKETVTKVLASGATDFIAKPFNAGVFIQKVQRAATASSKPTVPRQAKQNDGRILFSSELIDTSELVDVTQETCRMRASPFHRGGTIYDTATLALELSGQKPLFKGRLIRLEEEPDATDRKTMLADFRLADLSEAHRRIIDTYTSSAKNAASCEPVDP